MGRVFASSDWHGCGNVADKVFDFLKPDDTLYFIGDAIDRGPDGIKILTRLLSDSRVKFIMGNHEQFMEECLPEAISTLKASNDILSYEWIYSCWVNNGGSRTINGLYDLSIPEVEELYQKIKNLPYQLLYKSPKGHTVLLEHAGYSPFVLSPRRHDPLWDREHFRDVWDAGYRPDFCGDPDTTYLVHGHTPVQYLTYEYGYYGKPAPGPNYLQEKHNFLYSDKTDALPKPEVIRYCEEHKFCIDMCTIVSNRIVLLDLDTFETVYIDG